MYTRHSNVFPLYVLVSGPEFQRVRVGVGHRLDAFSSGVLGMILNLNFVSDPVLFT